MKYGHGVFGGSSGLLQPGVQQQIIRPRICDSLLDKKIIDISCGRNHGIALSQDGTIYSWGSSEFGQRGQIDKEPNTERWTPGRIESLCNKDIVSIASGLDHNVAVTNKGALYVWGYGGEGQLGLGATGDFHQPQMLLNEFSEGNVFNQILCGGDYTALLTANGVIFTFGCNYFGQLGHGTSGNSILSPQIVKFFNNIFIEDIGGGAAHMIALTNKGEVYTWGKTEHGRLGISLTQELISTPQLVTALTDKNITRVAAGGGYSYAISDKDKKLYAFGQGGQGSYGYGDKTEPTEVLELTGKELLGIACGLQHVIAATKD